MKVTEFILMECWEVRRNEEWRGQAGTAGRKASEGWSWARGETFSLNRTGRTKNICLVMKRSAVLLPLYRNNSLMMSGGETGVDLQLCRCVVD